MPISNLNVVLVQMNAAENTRENFAKVMRFLCLSLKHKPDIICLPETFLYYGDDIWKHAFKKGNKYVNRIREFAKKNSVNIILGSIMLESSLTPGITNTSLVLNRKGRIAYRYDKMYLYDVMRPNIRVEESRHVRPGKRPGFFILEGIPMGIGICVDLRYPEYFRGLVKKGAKVIFLPASFRQRTGALAWNCLTVARAIENQVYFCGCNQTGSVGPRERCGGTSIVAYDGRKPAVLGKKEGIIHASLDLNAQEKFRREFPVLEKIR